MRTIKNIFCNVTTAELINSSGGAATAVQLYRGTQFVVRCTLYNSDLTPFILNLSDSFYFGLNDNYLRTNDDYCYSLNTSFNIPADWSSIDLEEGLISFRIDTDTYDLAVNMGALASKYYLGEIWAISSGLPVLLCQFPILMNNIAVEPNTSSSSSSGGI